MDLEQKTLSIKRTFEASITSVWHAWTNPNIIAKWWGRGMPITIKEHDFKIGGTWTYAMPMPDGNEFVSSGQYSKIEENTYLETSADFKPMTEGVILQISFLDLGDKTEVDFKVIHPSVEYCKQQEEMGFYHGWGSVFQTLEDLLEDD